MDATRSFNFSNLNNLLQTFMKNKDELSIDKSRLPVKRRTVVIQREFSMHHQFVSTILVRASRVTFWIA